MPREKNEKKNAGAGAGSGDAQIGSGKIYLLEHGRSEWDWVSNILDKHADPHAKRWGCYWNRDILAIVREAGLEIESVARYHLGTTPRHRRRAAVRGLPSNERATTRAAFPSCVVVCIFV